MPNDEDMHYDEDQTGILTHHTQHLRDFVTEVQQRAGLKRYAEAHQLASATVGVLGESISGGEAKQLAQWLPKELATELSAKTGQATAFDKANFVEKVGGKVYSVDTEKVEGQIEAVLRTLRETAKSGELSDTIDQLPPELAAMFGSQR